MASAAFASPCEMAATTGPVTGHGTVRRAPPGNASVIDSGWAGADKARVEGRCREMGRAVGAVNRLRIGAAAGDAVHGDPDQPVTMPLRKVALTGFPYGI